MAGAASQQTAGSCGRNRLTRCGTGDGGGTWGGGGVGDWRGRRCGTGDGGGGGGAGSKLERGNLVEMGWDKPGRDAMRERTEAETPGRTVSLGRCCNLLEHKMPSIPQETGQIAI